MNHCMEKRPPGQLDDTYSVRRWLYANEVAWAGMNGETKNVSET